MSKARETKAATQYMRARALRKRMMKLFPELSTVKDELEELLDEAQNGPPYGEADGSIGATQYAQLRSILVTLRRFLVAQLFDTQSSKET